MMCDRKHQDQGEGQEGVDRPVGDPVLPEQGKDFGIHDADSCDGPSAKGRAVGQFCVRKAERGPAGDQAMRPRARAMVMAVSSIMSSWPPTMPRRPSSTRMSRAGTPYLALARLAKSRKEPYTPA